MRFASVHDGEIRVRVYGSWRELAMGWLLAALYAASAGFIYANFEALTPKPFFAVWTVATLFFIAAMFGLPAAVAIRRPNALEMHRVWSPLIAYVGLAYSLQAAASVWLLLPFAEEPLRLVMVVFYVAICAWLVISAAETVWTGAVGMVAVATSTSLFFAVTPGEYSRFVGVFMPIFGALLLGVAFSMKRIIRSALEARLSAERAAVALEAALQDARSAREERERFMAAASHDLRQPIHAATLFFHKLVRTKDPAVRAQAEAGVKLAFEEADALLERMLDHLRLEASAVEARVEALSVAGIFHRAVGESAAMAEAGGVRLKAAATGLWVTGDRSMISGALRNFIHNAIRHADAGQIRLIARVRGLRVRLYAFDDGRGVPQDELDGLFQPYTQGKRSGQMARSGLGLGLASARRMADLMGGEVGLDAAWTKGAAFYLELPRAEPRAPAKPPAAPLARRAAARRVLIVDDDDAARAALAGIFATEGWGVMTAADPNQALRLAEAETCDLMISDWRLADGQTGADAVAAVHGPRPDLPVLIVTGDGSWQTHKAIALSGLPVLFKPTAPGRILSLAEHLSAAT